MSILCFIRHADADKNTVARFSDPGTVENLTAQGLQECKRLALGLDNLLTRHEFKLNKVFHAPSHRSGITATFVAEQLGISSEAVPGFDSINSGPFAGLTEDEVQKRSPVFSSQLRLYRAGIVSSYDIDIPRGAERVGDFEGRVNVALDRLLTCESGDFIAIVAHRSPITAWLLRFAREFYGYPLDFYGYIELHTGRCSIVKISENERGIICVDSLPEDLTSSDL